jgi:hypothetical protein
MTLLEALIAIAIATLTIVTGLEASRHAGERSAIAALDIEAATMAANLVVGADLAGPDHLEGRDDRTGTQWTVALVANDPEFSPRAVDVTARVRIVRGGLVSEKTVSELRLNPGPHQ